MAHLDLRPMVHPKFKGCTPYVGPATLVFQIPAKVEPKATDVVKYYGGKTPIPASAFKAINTARLIFQKPSGGYIVLPVTEKSKKCYTL